MTWRTTRLPALMDTTRLETMPAWSPDGRTLFFCSSPQQKVPQGYKDIHCSICSIAFDPEEMARIAKTDPGINVSFKQP